MAVISSLLRRQIAQVECRRLKGYILDIYKDTHNRVVNIRIMTYYPYVGLSSIISTKRKIRGRSSTFIKTRNGRSLFIHTPHLFPSGHSSGSSIEIFDP